jgi:hypothetical protein
MDDWLLDDVLPRPDPTAPPRVLSIEQARRLGYTRHAIAHRVATGRWRRVLPRTYLTVETFGRADRLRAALAFAGPAALLSGGAALAGEFRSVGWPTSVLVLRPGSPHSRTTGWVRVRQTQRMPIRRAAGGPARVPVARAVADLARELRRLDDVRAVVAEAIRSGRCGVDELRNELDCGPRPGSAHLRVAIADMATGAWSAPEARAARLLRRAGVPPFEQNVRIRLPGGRTVIVDFLWRELRAVLEIDSIEHHFAPADLDATMDRHLLLETLGLSVIHRSPRVVATEPARFVRDVALRLDARRLAVINTPDGRS